MRLTGKITFEGIGLHSGNNCRVLIEPCESHEVMLCSGDDEYPLRQLRTEGTNRGSDYIFPSGERVRTCEHVLSAIAGTGIYSCVRVVVEGGEMPALDGCARTLSAQILRQSEPSEDVPALEVSSPVMVSNDDGTRYVSAFPSDKLHITYIVEYENVGVQMYDYVQSPESYIADIAGARTFACERDIEYLRSKGMALGGSLDNAILIGDTIQAKGGLRWTNEFVRHKILDLIGDLASIGKPLKAHITAVRAGHELHLMLADKLKEE